METLFSAKPLNLGIRSQDKHKWTVGHQEQTLLNVIMQLNHLTIPSTIADNGEKDTLNREVNYSSVQLQPFLGDP